MKNITEILKDVGVEVPEDKQGELNRALSENYKTVAEFDKKLRKSDEERDAWRERAEAAEKTLEGFDGIDIETMNRELADWKRKAEEAEKNAQARIAERDFDDALKTELDGIEFTSAAAKRAVTAEIREAGLKLKDGKILGLSDLIEQMKKDDSSAFVDHGQQQLEQSRAKFASGTGKTGGSSMTRDDIMKIKDIRERRRAIAENISLFTKQEE